MKKSLNQFIKEMVINLLLVIIIIVAMIGGVFPVKFEFNLISIGFIVLLSLLLIHVFKSIKIGLMATIDVLSKSTYEIEGIMQAQIPYEGSCFSDKFDEDRHICPDIRFSIVIKTKDKKNVSLISQSYIDTPIGEKCTLLVAKHSGIVIVE